MFQRSVDDTQCHYFCRNNKTYAILLLCSKTILKSQLYRSKRHQPSLLFSGTPYILPTYIKSFFILIDQLESVYCK